MTQFRFGHDVPLTQLTGGRESAMPFQPIRFIHAADLRLDSQMRGLDGCADDLRGTIETATISAFESTIDACVAERVDFVLLTGNCFDESERSLPARIALLDGFQRLDRHGIRVFILPGRLDPADAWQSMDDMPDNVTTFYDSATDAVAVLRDGKVIASVGCVHSSDDDALPDTVDRSDTHESANWGPVRIGMCLVDEASSSNTDAERAFDYIALGGTSTRRTQRGHWGVLHSPGSTQALEMSEAGERGCTLVEVAVDGAIECRLIPTAPVRLENMSLCVDGQSSQGDLIEKMHELLDEREFHKAEQLWLVRWTMAGSGPVYDRLCDDDYARQFLDRVTVELQSETRCRMVHSLQVLPDRAAVDEILHSHPWTAEYFNSLTDDAPQSSEFLSQRSAESSPLPTELAERVATFVDRTDQRLILSRARQFGIARFRQTATYDS